jgi:hypothetical protein
MFFGTNQTKGVVMKSRSRAMKWLLSSVCVPACVFFVFILYKGCVLFDTHEYNKFISAYDSVIVGSNLADVSKLLGEKPVYDFEMTADNIGLINQCGLKSLPPMGDYSELRFAAFPWTGIPHRFIFTFYTKKESNVVAKAHCKM